MADLRVLFALGLERSGILGSVRLLQSSWLRLETRRRFATIFAKSL